MSIILNIFVDFQKPQVKLDGKPCAIIGKSGLIALYDSLFSQVYNSFRVSAPSCGAKRGV